MIDVPDRDLRHIDQHTATAQLGQCGCGVARTNVRGLTQRIDPNLELSVDTMASIMTEGVLGNKFVSLEPGAEEELLKQGEEVGFTESAVLLERLIGKFVNDAGLDEEE